MANARPFSYITGTHSLPSGIERYGNLLVGNAPLDYSTNPMGVTWWNGPDESTGYVIAKSVPSGTQPTELSAKWDHNYLGTGNTLSLNDTVVTNTGVNSSVLGTRIVTTNDKVMFTIQINQTINGSIGFGKHDMNINSYVGGDGVGIGFGSDGNYYNSGAVQDSGLPTWGTNRDIVDIALDQTSGFIWIRVNGGNWNGTRDENPASGSGTIFNAGLDIVYPALTPYQGVAKFLSDPVYSVPSGFTFLGRTLAPVAFIRSADLTDSSFVECVNYTFAQNYSSPFDAHDWLIENGYWSSYLKPVLLLDAGNTSSYPGSGNTWTDLVGGKTFNLINGPGYDPADGGKLYFYAPSGQYAQCNTSLSSLPTFTTVVWHWWDGINTGILPCILTEIYVGGPINYFVGNLQGVVAQAGYFNGGFQVSPQFTVTPNNWYQIVTTCDSSQTVSVYVNSTLISTTPTTGSAPSSSNSGIRLMRRWDDTDYWGGYLATVGIYDKALDSSQISALWTSSKSRFGL